MERKTVKLVALAAATIFIVTLPIKTAHSSDIPEENTGIEKYSSYEDQEFPQSKFGYAPARGVNRVLTETEHWDKNEKLSSKGVSNRNRAPAGVANNSPQMTQDTEASMYSGPADRKRVEFAKDVDSVSARRKGIQEVALIANDLGFFPKTVFVTRDIPVRMFVTGASKGTLCLMMDSFQVRKQVRTQKIEEITFTPNQPGQYRFYCPVNGMEGTLIVKELAG